MQQFSDDQVGPGRSKLEIQVVDTMPSIWRLASDITLVNHQSQRMLAKQDGSTLASFDSRGMNIPPTLRVRAQYVYIVDEAFSSPDETKFTTPLNFPAVIIALL